jgi:hypothetical protein
MDAPDCIGFCGAVLSASLALRLATFAREPKLDQAAGGFGGHQEQQKGRPKPPFKPIALKVQLGGGAALLAPA